MDSGKPAGSMISTGGESAAAPSADINRASFHALETKIRELEVLLEKSGNGLFSWKNRQFLALVTAGLVAVGGVAVPVVDGIQERMSEKQKAEHELLLEQHKTEQQLLLEKQKLEHEAARDLVNSSKDASQMHEKMTMYVEGIIYLESQRQNVRVLAYQNLYVPKGPPRRQ